MFLLIITFVYLQTLMTEIFIFHNTNYCYCTHIPKNTRFECSKTKEKERKNTYKWMSFFIFTHWKIVSPELSCRIYKSLSIFFLICLFVSERKQEEKTFYKLRGEKKRLQNKRSKRRTHITVYRTLFDPQRNRINYFPLFYIIIWSLKFIIPPIRRIWK